MSANSKIEWTDHTFNPWIGCTKVSSGCAHCYAEGEDKRRGRTLDGREWNQFPSTSQHLNPSTASA
jgi:protein gp37